MHTPGPWRIEEEPRSNEITAIDNGGCRVLRVKVYGHTEENIKANTRLIAAAPELLEACNIAIHTIKAIDHNTPEQMKDPKFWIDMRARLYAIEEAAKKAEGSQP